MSGTEYSETQHRKKGSKECLDLIFMATARRIKRLILNERNMEVRKEKLY